MTLKRVVKRGKVYGYYTNAVKTWLITKKDHYQVAKEAFADTKVQVTYEGRPYLGVPLGTENYCQSFVMEKVEQWTKELELLSSIATSQPHAAYTAFTHGLMSKWSYFSRTTPNINSSLQPLETTIRTKLIPALTGRAPPNDTERELLALPARLGGLALANPVKLAEFEFYASSKITAPLSQEIMSQTLRYPDTIIERQIKEKTVTHQERRQLSNRLAQSIHESLTPSLKRSMDLAQEKGASSWLTSLPIKEFGFSLHKGAFRDALALRYNWEPSHLPAKCDCGKTFTVEHALSCPKGGLPTVRHNEIRDLTTNLLSEVCKDVRIEPELQPVTGETFTDKTANTQDGARLDIAANGLWGGRFERTYVDVRIFNPHAPSNHHPSLAACYKKHENIKKRTYQRRVCEVEHASFTPLVMSATGGMAREATVFYKRLASCLATKWDKPYSSTLHWLRCRVIFSLLRSAICCIRGARSSCGHTIGQHPAIDLAIAESQ